MDNIESIREPRIRVNISQSVKGIHTVEVTVEQAKHRWTVSNPSDLGEVEEKTIGQLAIEILKDTEERLKADGRKIAREME